MRYILSAVFSLLFYSGFAMYPIPDEYVEGEILVKFKPSSQTAAMLENTRLGVRVLEQIGGIGVTRMKLPKNLSVVAAVEHYNKLPFVEFAEPNGIVRIAYTPNDPQWGQQWGPKNIDAPGAWDIHKGQSSIRISIADTGISNNHPDLASKVVAGYNFYNGNSNWNDNNGHGSHCAGIAAAITDNGIGIAGVGFNCSLMAAKVLSSGGSGSWSQVANGINWSVSNGAKVVSLSLGSTSGSSTLSSAINNAWNNNVLPVAAAGNNGNTQMFYPAAYANCLSVASNTSSNGKSSFSTYGTWVDVAAPGSSIYSTYSGTGYATLSGTSMACPHVAGIAGLVWSYFGTNKSVTFVRNQIQDNCDNVGGWIANGWCKYGRVNAKKALSGGSIVEQEFSPNFVDRVFGEKRGGNLASLISSDNNYWWMNAISPGPGQNAKIEWYCTSTLSYPGNLQQLDVIIEAHSVPAFPVQLYLMNWNTGNLVLIGQVNLTSSDTTQTFTITSGLNNYVVGGDVLAYFAMSGANLVEMKTDMVKFKTYSQ